MLFHIMKKIKKPILILNLNTFIMIMILNSIFYYLLLISNNLMNKIYKLKLMITKLFFGHLRFSKNLLIKKLI